MKLNLLIFGVSGLLGNNVARVLSKKYNILGTYFENKPNFDKNVRIKALKINLYKINIIKSSFINKFKPNIILNCAGEPDVDYCEKNHLYSKKIIVNATKIISNFAKKEKAYFINISTDSLFDGKRKYYSETDNVRPINLYSKFKIEAEKFLKSNNKNCLIIRTRFYGKNITNNLCFAEKIIDRLERNQIIECYNNVFNTQISCLNLAEILDECIQKKIVGIYNIVGSERCSKVDFAKEIANVYGFDKSLIKSKKYFNKKKFVTKPLDTSLSNKAIKKIIKTPILSLREGIYKMYEQEN